MANEWRHSMLNLRPDPTERATSASKTSQSTFNGDMSL